MSKEDSSINQTIKAENSSTANNNIQARDINAPIIEGGVHHHYDGSSPQQPTSSSSEKEPAKYEQHAKTIVNIEHATGFHIGDIIGSSEKDSSSAKDSTSSQQRASSMKESQQQSSRDESTPKVFISYSHDSKEHEYRVLGLSDKLRDDGIDSDIDQYNQNPSEGWPRWMEKKIDEADYVLLVCTETYHRRVTNKEEEGKGLGVCWESNIIYNLLYGARTINKKFIAVLFREEDKKFIPAALAGYQHYLVSGDISNDKGYENLYRYITEQPHIEKPELGTIKVLPKRERNPI